MLSARVLEYRPNQQVKLDQHEKMWLHYNVQDKYSLHALSPVRFVRNY